MTAGLDEYAGDTAGNSAWFNISIWVVWRALGEWVLFVFKP